jgi:thymidylate kinase
MLPERKGRGPILISFSGVDGSGKSTQIEGVVELLEHNGLRVRRLTFWDDVVVLTRYREGFVHRVFNSENGIGAPDRPVNRRDKNMRGWHLTLARHLLYLLDAIHLRMVITRERRGSPDVIVMDRYIFDELANLPLRSTLSRVFVRMIAALVPRPDLAFLLDADPEAARARKPEYPVEFMRECRGWYHQLAALLGGMTVIPPLQLTEARQQVISVVSRVLSLNVALPVQSGACQQAS